MKVQDLEFGDEIEVKWKRMVLKGILISKDSEFLNLKLKNGYNLSLDISKVTSLKLIEKKINIPTERKSIKGKGKRVSILGTGGTIASYVDYATGAVKPLETAQDVLYAEPELQELGDIDAEIVFNIFSEDMNSKYWEILAKKVFEKTSNGEGVVVTHGTDTMSFTSSALSFMIDNPEAPIVLTGSQRSSDRPSSDAHFNLLGSVKVAQSDLGEVAVVMHSTSSGNSLTIHRGVNVRKMHTSRRDAFKSINSEPIGTIDSNLSIKFAEYRKINGKPSKLYEKMNEKVSLIYYYPGMDKEILYGICERKDGMIIAGTGLGHVSNTFISDLEGFVKDGKIIGMTSQCLNGSVNLDVYSTGRRLTGAGVISLGDMLPEVAYVKLSFLLGNFTVEESKLLLNRNLKGEIHDRRRE